MKRFSIPVKSTNGESSLPYLEKLGFTVVSNTEHDYLFETPDGWDQQWSFDRRIISHRNHPLCLSVYQNDSSGDIVVGVSNNLDYEFDPVYAATLLSSMK